MYIFSFQLWLVYNIEHFYLFIFGGGEIFEGAWVP